MKKEKVGAAMASGVLCVCVCVCVCVRRGDAKWGWEKKN